LGRSKSRISTVIILFFFDNYKAHYSNKIAISDRNSAETRKHTMVGLKYFKGGERNVRLEEGWQKYTECNKTNNDSENFRPVAKLLLGGLRPL